MCKDADISEYDCIGIASGIAYGKYYPQMLEYLSKKMTKDKMVFFIHTAGDPKEKHNAAAKAIADNLGCKDMGTYYCKGFDTYGPWKGDSFEEADVTENNLTNFKASCETLRVDFEKLKSINSDVVAWIYSPNTVINYPVVQAKDNSYYLTHLMDGTVNKNGCLFIECKNKNPFLDDNTIIYGHNMASGKMFAELLNYRSQDYYNGHKFIYLITEEVTYKMELFTSFTTDPGSDAYTISLGDKNNFASWLRKMAENADFETKMKINTNDRIVTLSTCSYSRKNARYVVMGRLVELENEDVSN